MAKHNYSKYSNKTNPAVDNEPVDALEVVETVDAAPVVEPVAEPVVEAVVDPVITPVAEAKGVTGTVVGCSRLNVRAKPNTSADIVCVINAATKVTIDEKKTNRDWYYVRTTTGAEGYCMRKYVEARL